ncbi:hypothetical protein [Dietzia sp. B32]|uniref:hypothetical protein n=1 Tax=Dietzia sp. B32 TaxID=2915130 RepID=UPI0021AD7A96|nr:hypothetical protein [Dietzia sp. B32]UVE95102.1 hypothetical protein L8M95_16645 [Dietzia sp. B32]
MTPTPGGRSTGVISLIALLAVAAAGGGCAALSPTYGPPQVVVTETVATVTGLPVQGGVGAPGDLASLSAEPPPADLVSPPAPVATGATAVDLDSVVAAVPEDAGIAVVPVGGGEPREAGTWRTGVAWSTIKVPLAVAVARTDPRVLRDNAAAISVSDNRAAENLWSHLGGGAASAAATGRILTEGGDVTSEVPSVRMRPGYTVFGQTRWALVDQTRFASALPCMDGASPVIELMGRIAPDQRWGLGRLPGARFKGGWGPGDGGGYLVRQFGLIPAAGGDVAVSLAVDAPTFEAGTAALSTMADALAPQLASLPGGGC